MPIEKKLLIKQAELAICRGSGRRRWDPGKSPILVVTSTSCGRFQVGPTSALIYRLADLTYIATSEGWLYMAAIMDLHTRKIVGWSMRDHLRAELATSALMMAIQRQRPGSGLVQHSARGIQYACGDYQVALGQAGITPSMSRRANPLDNARWRASSTR